MLMWQIAEYLGLIPLLFRGLLANREQAGTAVEKIPFGPHPRQYILFCQPEPPAPQAAPLIFFLHGGGWSSGTPHVFRFIGHSFARLGFPTALGGYRLAPAHRFPAQLEDAYAGLQMAVKVAAERGIDSKRILLGGQSAGAQLAGLISHNREELAKRQMRQEIFAGLLLISGPLDFSVCRNRTVRKLLGDYLGGDPQVWEQADPIRHVRGDESIPLLCIHGAKDPLVDTQNSFSFAGRVNGDGRNLAEVRIVNEGYHSDLVTLFIDRSATADYMVDWLKSLWNKRDK